MISNSTANNFHVYVYAASPYLQLRCHGVTCCTANIYKKWCNFNVIWNRFAVVSDIFDWIKRKHQKSCPNRVRATLNNAFDAPLSMKLGCSTYVSNQSSPLRLCIHCQCSTDSLFLVSVSVRINSLFCTPLNAAVYWKSSSRMWRT